MKLSMQLALAAMLSALACGDPPVVPTGAGGLVVATVVAPHTVLPLDAGRILVRDGPTSRTVDVTPGQTVTIDGLLPGSYTVALEGLVGGAVNMFGKQSDIQVAAGNNTMVTVDPFASFVPVVSPLPSLDTVKTILVGYAVVANAVSYQIQADTDNSFAPPMVDVTGVTQNPYAITVPIYGKYYVQVGAKNEYGSAGGWARAPQPIRLVDPIVLTTVTALAGEAFADTLVGTLSLGVRSAIRSAWDNCGTGAAALNVDTIQQCVDTVQIRAATACDPSTDPTDCVLLNVLVFFVNRIEALLGL